MKKKVISTLFALVLAVGLSLMPAVPAVPAVADSGSNQIVFETWGTAIAEWSTTPSGFAGDYCIKLTSPGGGHAGASNCWTNSVVRIPYGDNLTTLASIGTENIIFRLYRESSVPFGLLYIDTNLDGKVDVLMHSKMVEWPAVGAWDDGLTQADHWSPVGYDEGTITTPVEVDGTSYGFQGGYPGVGDEMGLSAWAAKSSVWANADVMYVGFGYCCDSDPAYVDDIIIDGVTYALEPIVLDAEYYKTDATVGVTVYNTYASSGSIGGFAKSTTVGDLGAITFVLDETSPDVFTGSFKLVDTTPGAGELLVNEGDSITVKCLSDWGAGSQEIGWGPTGTVDDTAPVIEIVSPAVSANITDIQPEIKATYTDVSGSGVDNATAVMTLNGDPVTPQTVTVDEIIYTPIATDNLSDGSYEVIVDVDDVAGNAATQARWSFTVDTEAPVITGQVATPGIVSPEISANITFTATVTDATSDVATVTIDVSSIDTATALAMLDSGDGIYSANITTTIADEDTYLLLVTATDCAGNSDSANITLVVSSDTTAPVIASPAITYLYGLSSAPPGGTVTISANVTEAVGMGIVTAACTAFTGSVSLLDGGSAPDVTAGDDIYTGTGTVASVVAGDYTVTITAEDAKGNEATPVSLILTVAPAVTGYDIDLVEGWNLISLPLIPTDDSIDVVLADISDNVSQVRTFVYVDGVLTEKFWMEGGTVGLLDDMVDGQGYWIEMTEAKTLTVQGSELPGAGGYMPEYDVYEGWNLIGFKSLDESTDAEAYLGGAVTLIFERMYGYDASGGIYIAILPGTDLEPGQGYWLAVSADGTIYP